MILAWIVPLAVAVAVHIKTNVGYVTESSINSRSSSSSEREKKNMKRESTFFILTLHFSKRLCHGKGANHMVLYARSR